MKNIRYDEVAGLLARREIVSFELHFRDYGCTCSICLSDYDPNHYCMLPRVVDHRGTVLEQSLCGWLQQIASWRGQNVHGNVFATPNALMVSISDLHLGGTHADITYHDWEADFGATPFAEWCEKNGHTPANEQAHIAYRHYLDTVAPKSIQE